MKIPTTRNKAKDFISVQKYDSFRISCTACGGIPVMSVGIFKVHWATSEHIMKAAPRGGVSTQ